LAFKIYPFGYEDFLSKEGAVALPCEFVRHNDLRDATFFGFDPEQLAKKEGEAFDFYLMGWIGAMSAGETPVWVVMPPKYRNTPVSRVVSDWRRVTLVFNADPVDGLATILRKNFIALPYADYLKTPHWQDVREAALKAADYRCQVCYSPDKIQVHHRTYDRRGRELPSDVTVLCDTCHGLYHSRMRKGGE
jgi:hypothetical protein